MKHPVISPLVYYACQCMTERRCILTHSGPRHKMEVSNQLHDPAALPQGRASVAQEDEYSTGLDTVQKTSCPTGNSDLSPR
jgi:hypothetical protein